jgi:Flp pilus assembly pilin Flp
VAVRADINLTMRRPGPTLNDPQRLPAYTPISARHTSGGRSDTLRIVTSHVLSNDAFATDVEPANQDSPTNDKVTLPMSGWTRLLIDDNGATTVEYAVMLALILLTCLGAVTSLGGNAGGMWQDNRSSLETAMDGS